MDHTTHTAHTSFSLAHLPDPPVPTREPRRPLGPRLGDTLAGAAPVGRPRDAVGDYATKGAHTLPGFAVAHVLCSFWRVVASWASDLSFGIFCEAAAPALIVLLAAGCAPPVDQVQGASQALAGNKKVAAVQYASGGYAAVDATCASSTMPDACAVGKLVAQAQAKGAVLVVAPEYGLGQKYYEPVPKLGENPGTSSSWTDDALIKIFSEQAAKLSIHLLIDLQTSEGTGQAKHNTLVAFGPSGKVVGVHHKFELFDSEAKNLTPGKDVSVFDSPVGKVGLLICADMYGDLRMHHKLTQTLKARVVAVSSLWTAPAGHRWQQNFAKNWGVYVVGSNTTSGAGRGGGVYGPDGKALAEHLTSGAAVIMAEIPVP